MNSTLIIYCINNSERLRYTLDWLFSEQLQVDYKITTDEADISSSGAFVSYGKYFEGAITIPDASLLWETNIEPTEVKTGIWNNIPTLFASGGHSIPFDIFSAIFFLLSRYEEYLEYKADEHGRYPANESVLYKNKILERPIIDEWITAFRTLLSQKLSVKLPQPVFRLRITYDIDIAYSYKYKGLKRTAGAYLKDIVYGNIKKFIDRSKVQTGAGQDPYDSFERILSLHKKNNIHPVYFILAAQETTAFDKNISPRHKIMQNLIKQLAKDGLIGMHPSYYSNVNEQAFSSEKNILEDITQSVINISRQHYIRLKLPDTYTRLLSHGIAEDYSMGYSTHLGFRAGTGKSFLWYNLKEECCTGLRIYPFYFMDTTARFEMNLAAAEAFERLENMTDILKTTGSTLTTVFHNFSLGTDDEWGGWYDQYRLFLNKYPGTNTNH